MTKFDKECFRQMEEAVKDLENITIDDPGLSIEYQDMRHKNIKEYLGKLIKKNEETKD
jgi:hypothetical protein